MTNPSGPNVPPRRRRRRRQQPKRSYRVRRSMGPGYPVAAPPGPPTAGQNVVTEIDMEQPLPEQEMMDSYPGANERHAVTTNQEPSFRWPPVDLPPLSGFTVGNSPIDNGQAYMNTTYDVAAPVSDVPFNDYNATGNPPPDLSDDGIP